MAQGPKPEVTGRFPDQPAEGGEEPVEHDLEAVATTPAPGEDDIDAEDLDEEDALPLDEPGAIGRDTDLDDADLEDDKLEDDELDDDEKLEVIDTTKGLP